jgi:hypothetical protein
MINRQENSMLNRRNCFTSLLGVALALSLGAGTASADQVTYDLTSYDVSGYTGPFTQVTVNLTGGANTNSATITFDSLTNGGYTYLFHSNNGVAVNVNGAATLSNFTATNSGAPFSTPVPSNGGSGQMDSYGTFNQSVSLFDGYQHSASEISFKVTRNSGTWSSASNVLAANGNGQIAAAQVGPWDGVFSDGFAQTGYAGDAQVVTSAPEPSSLAIAGLGALGFLAYGVRRRLKK